MALLNSLVPSSPPLAMAMSMTDPPPADSSGDGDLARIATESLDVLLNQFESKVDVVKPHVSTPFWKISSDDANPNAPSRYWIATVSEAIPGSLGHIIHVEARCRADTVAAPI